MPPSRLAAATSVLFLSPPLLAEPSLTRGSANCPHFALLGIARWAALWAARRAAPPVRFATPTASRYARAGCPSSRSYLLSRSGLPKEVDSFSSVSLNPADV